MTCRYCEKRLSLAEKLKWSEFCSGTHRRSYELQREREAFEQELRRRAAMHEAEPAPAEEFAELFFPAEARQIRRIVRIQPDWFHFPESRAYPAAQLRRARILPPSKVTLPVRLQPQRMTNQPDFEVRLFLSSPA